MGRTIQSGGWIAAAVLMAMTALPCRAAETAVLRNGFSIRHERRQDMGIITRLFVSGDGSSFVDVPTAEIDHIEASPDGVATAPVKQSAQSGPQPPQRSIDIDELVASASGTYSLDPDLVNSVIRAESGFNVRAVSPKGAQGLMQLMPQTASALGVENAFDPQANVEGGTRYLRELLERYNFDLIKALAAYNAGPERVERYGGVPPYYETKAYVARIVRDFNKKKLAAKNAQTSPPKTAARSKPISKKAAAKPPMAKPPSSTPQSHTSSQTIASN